mgnify:CR=1 FL=1
MTRLALPVVLAALAVAGCSSAGLTTGGIFGGKAETAAVTPPNPNGDPATRALQVGSTAARAVKCGYNFDPMKLKASYLAYETGMGADVAGVQKITQIYDVAYNGVTKAAAGDQKYCTPDRTAEIKTALTRHLAGDFAPVFKAAAPQEDTGLFGGIWGGGSNTGSDKDVAIDQRTITGN